MTKKNLLVITNVYPLPWQPTRGTYNKIQLDNLNDDFNIKIIVPIPITQWLKQNTKQQDNVSYVWQIYLPVIGTPINGLLLFFSLLINSFFSIKQFKPEVFFTCWSYPDGLAGCLLAKLFNRPFFLKVHGSDVNVHCQYPVRRKQIVWLANHAKKVMCVSNALKNKLISSGVKQDKPVVIYNGVNKAVFSPDDQTQAHRILFVGNIKRSKGVFEALEGFAKIAEEFPTFELTFIGDGPDLTELKTNTERLKLSQRVEFLGAKSHTEIADILKSSYLLLLPSHAEGVPNVILEAMSCGIPSVATAVGGIPEILEDGHNGFLVNSIDSQAVANTLKKALQHVWDKDKITNSADKFDWQKNAQQLKTMLLSYSD